MLSHDVDSPVAGWSSHDQRMAHDPVIKARWTDPGACSAICALILDDRRSCGSQPSKRRPLPPALYAEHIAPFLRFEGPLPNMLYAIGGRSQRHGSLASVEMFDTWHGQWVPCPDMPTHRAGSAAAVLPDGGIIVVGGYNERGIVEGLLKSCDLFDPFKRQWTQDGACPLMRARWGHGCAALGGRIFVVGGCSLQHDAQPQEAFMETLRSCEVFTPETSDMRGSLVKCSGRGKWRACAPLQVPRSGSRVVALGERHLAAVGGCDDVFGRAETQPTIELYDAAAEYWTVLSRRLEHPRTTAAVAAVDSHRLVVVGGAPSLASAEIYNVAFPSDHPDLHLNREQEEDSELVPHPADMDEGRMGCQAAMVSLPAREATYPLSNSRCVVIVGGERCNEGSGDWPRVRQFSSVPVYDVEGDCWRADERPVVPPMSSPRTAVALCVGLGHVAATLQMQSQ